jgi:hypothetical protein
MRCSEASPWISTSPRQVNRAWKLPVDADELGMLQPGRRRSPPLDHLRPRQLVPRHRGELLVLIASSVVSILVRSIPAPGHCLAPPLGHATGNVPMTKNYRHRYHSTRLDPLNLFRLATLANSN